jgi:protein-tyrosine phosphatase
VFQVVKIKINSGFVGLCPMPGKFSSFHEDFSQLVNSGPKVVVTCATTAEMIDCSANSLPQQLQNLEIKWFQLTVDDFQVPDKNNEEKWKYFLPTFKKTVLSGGGVIFNCLGGCGRSGMFSMRLLREMGWSSEHALERLRSLRPCAIETEDQMSWASKVD